jgi:hypothetical protein
MKIKPYIVWYADIDKIDLNDPWIKKWYIQQVLVHGRFEDIRELDFKEIKKTLPLLHGHNDIKSLWKDYFTTRKI